MPFMRIIVVFCLPAKSKYIDICMGVVDFRYIYALFSLPLDLYRRYPIHIPQFYGSFYFKISNHGLGIFKYGEGYNYRRVALQAK